MRNKTARKQKFTVVHSDERLEQYYVTAGYQYGPVYISVVVDAFASKWIDWETRIDYEVSYKKDYQKTSLEAYRDALYIRKGKSCEMVKPDALFLDLSKVEGNPSDFIAGAGIRVNYKPWMSEEDLIIFESGRVSEIWKCFPEKIEEPIRFKFQDATIYRKE